MTAVVSVPHSKVEARFEFRHENESADLIAGPFDGHLHLFEHQYDKYVEFWYGYAHVLCTSEDWLRPLTESERAGVYHTCIDVNVADGRSGCACVTYYKRAAQQGRESESLFFGLVGVTPL